jgi:hypothetical protein
MPIQFQIITAFLVMRDRMTAVVRHVREDERGELTGSVILLAALALAAVVVGGIIAAKLNSNAGRVPG